MPVLECEAFVRDVPEVLRPLLACDPVSLDEALVILHDPLIPAGENWLRPQEGPRAHPRFLTYFSKNTPPRVRVYVPTTAPTGFSSGTPRYEGLWRSAQVEASELPWPTPDLKWTSSGAFVKRLDALEASAPRVTYRGFSNCRLCGQRNGHEAFRLDVWEWPSGLRHYVAEHHVRPSVDFEQFVSSQGASSLEGAPSRA